MKWIVLLSTLCLLLGFVPAQAEASSRVTVLQLDGAVQPASLRYVQRGLERAAAEDADLVVLELNTPGGTLLSLRSLTTAITQSEVPVVVFVTPPGARAASAGFFLLLAADVAAMAPGTNTGAAHPVAPGQQGNEHRENTSITKATEDARALARALASARGRSVEWSDKAVHESRSYAAEEAREHGLIEIIADHRSALLAAIDGRSIRRFDGREHVVQSSDAQVFVIEQTLAERALMVIADPQLAYLLLMVGFLGLMLELMNPGAIAPGVAGGVSLLLALYAFSVLPVNWVGFLLVAVGVGLLMAEAFVTSYGLLALCGVLSFVFGSWMLIDTPVPQWRVGLGLILPAAVVLAATSVFLLGRALRVRGARMRSGLEAMIGEVGEVVEGIDREQGEGRVFVHGEYWFATAEEPLPAGAKVQVDRVEGNRLRITPLRPAPA